MSFLSRFHPPSTRTPDCDEALRCLGVGDPSARSRLAPLGDVVSVAQGRRILRRGSRSNHAQYLVEGAVLVDHPDGCWAVDGPADFDVVAVAADRSVLADVTMISDGFVLVIDRRAADLDAIAAPAATRPSGDDLADQDPAERPAERSDQRSGERWVPQFSES